MFIPDRVVLVNMAKKEWGNTALFKTNRRKGFNLFMTGLFYNSPGGKSTNFLIFKKSNSISVSPRFSGNPADGSAVCPWVPGMRKMAIAALENVSGESGKFSGAFGKFSGVLEKFSGVFGKFSAVLEKFSGVFGKFSGVLEKFSGVFGKCSAEIKNCTSIQGKILTSC